MDGHVKCLTEQNPHCQICHESNEHSDEFSDRSEKAKEMLDKGLLSEQQYEDFLAGKEDDAMVKLVESFKPSYMVKPQLKKIHEQSGRMLQEFDGYLPEWAESEVTKAEQSLGNAHDYLMYKE